MQRLEELSRAGLHTVENTQCSGAALGLGATVTSWCPAGQSDVLFLSSEALLGEGDEIHGGIPICAPWFGKGRDEVEVPRPHGLVRWVPWRLTSENSDAGTTTLLWEVEGSEISHLPGADAYPSDIHFRHEVSFGQSLTLSLTVSSPSSSFILDEAFHTYFAVSDIHDVVIDGLGGSHYRDYTDGATRHASTDRLRIPGHTDRIYDGAGRVTITDAEREITLETRGGANTVVWNPGPEGAQSLTGWAGEDWTSMICVEVGNVQRNAVSVAAGGSHTLSLEIRSHLLPRPE